MKMRRHNPRRAGDFNLGIGPEMACANSPTVTPRQSEAGNPVSTGVVERLPARRVPDAGAPFARPSTSMDSSGGSGAVSSADRVRAGASRADWGAALPSNLRDRTTVAADPCGWVGRPCVAARGDCVVPGGNARPARFGVWTWIGPRSGTTRMGEDGSSRRGGSLVD